MDVLIRRNDHDEGVFIEFLNCGRELGANSETKDICTKLDA